MSDLIRDYLNLPEVRFLAEHWQAFLILALASGILIFFGHLGGPLLPWKHRR